MTTGSPVAARRLHARYTHVFALLVIGIVADVVVAAGPNDAAPVPSPWQAVSRTAARCAIETSNAEAENRDRARRAFDRYAAQWSATITPLKERADQLRRELVAIQNDLPGRGPVAPAAGDALEAYSAFRREAIALDARLRDEWVDAVGRDTSLLDGWWLTRSAEHARPRHDAVWFGCAGPLDLAVEVLAESAPDGSSTCRNLADLWQDLGRPGELRDSVLQFVSRAEQFHAAVERSLPARVRMLDALWERSLVKRHDRPRSEALRIEAQSARGEWTEELIESGLALARAEQSLIDALEAWLPDALGPRLRERWRSVSFGSLWTDPVSPASTLESLATDRALPAELRTRIATIADQHRSRTHAMSLELVEAEREHWTTVLASRPDEYNLRLALLAERADRLVTRRAAHMAAWTAVAESFRALGLEPPGPTPTTDDVSLEPYLREVKAYTLSGRSYRELAEQFRQSHRESLPDRGFEWPP